MASATTPFVSQRSIARSGQQPMARALTQPSPSGEGTRFALPSHWPGRREHIMSTSSDVREPVEMLAEEFVARTRRGEKPTPEEYCEKYPHLAGEIRDLFPALVMVEDLGGSSLAASGPDEGKAPARSWP